MRRQGTQHLSKLAPYLTFASSFRTAVFCCQIRKGNTASDHSVAYLSRFDELTTVLINAPFSLKVNFCSRQKASTGKRGQGKLSARKSHFLLPEITLPTEKFLRARKMQKFRCWVKSQCPTKLTGTFRGFQSHGRQMKSSTILCCAAAPAVSFRLQPRKKDDLDHSLFEVLIKPPVFVDEMKGETTTRG